MLNFRRVTSLAEDMEALGLRSPSEKRLQESIPAASEAGESVEGDGELSEARLARVRTKRMKSGDRAKARIARRKKKAQINRKNRMKRKKSQYKMRMKRVAKMKKGKKAGPRRQFRLVTGLEKKATMLESFETSMFLNATPEQFVESFKNIAAVATTLSRKFALIEDILAEEEKELGLPVMDPDSALGAEKEVSNVKAGDKTGDATEYAPGSSEGEAPAKVEQVEDPAAPEGKKKPEDLPEGEEMDHAMAEEDDMMDEGCDDEDMEMEEDEAGDLDMKESTKAAILAQLENNMPMDFELAALRTEAENMAAQVGAGMVSPVMAADVMGDMVSYLGGAMGLYMDVAKDMDNQYVGQDMPNENKVEPVEGEANKGVLGQAMPEGETPMDDAQKSGNAPKTGDATDTAK